MPVLLLPLASDKLKITGRTSIKMTSFQIEPPAPKIALGMIETGDEVVITFSWMLGLRNASELPPDRAPASTQTSLQHEPTPPTLTAADQREVIPAESIRFINTQLAQVLAIYADLSQAQLEIDDRVDRKSTRLNSSHIPLSRMPSSP